MSARRAVALSLGSNLGDRPAHLAAALRRLEDALLAELRVSDLYETAPVGVAGAQPDYLNLCVLGGSDRPARSLLRECEALEASAGRREKGLGLPRRLDVDLIFVGAERGEAPELTLPHPRMAGRRFVLAPLAELAPDWRHPADDRSVLDMLAESDPEQALRRLPTPEGWWRLEQHR